MNNVIVVEDFTLIAEAWQELLIDMGFDKVHLFKSDKGVLETIEAKLIDVILMDINIVGHLDGIQLSQLILTKFPNSKIIIVSIHKESSYICKAFNAGAAGYVTKNSALSELSNVIKRVIAGEKNVLSSDINVYKFPSI